MSRTSIELLGSTEVDKTWMENNSSSSAIFAMLSGYF